MYEIRTSPVDSYAAIGQNVFRIIIVIVGTEWLGIKSESFSRYSNYLID